MITLKDANGSISISKENTDNPWHNLAVEIPPLDTLNPSKNKEIGGCSYNAFKHLCQTNEHNEWVGCPNVTGQSGERKGWA